LDASKWQESDETRGKWTQGGPGDRTEAQMITKVGLTGNLDLQKEELPKLSLYCPLDEEDGHPRVSEAYRQNKMQKHQSNVKKT